MSGICLKTTRKAMGGEPVKREAGQWAAAEWSGAGGVQGAALPSPVHGQGLSTGDAL